MSLQQSIHMMNIPFKSKFFKDYYKSVQGAEIELDFINRQLLIINTDKQIVSTIRFSKSVQNQFTNAALLKTEHQQGDKIYVVYPDGFENLNWLWAGDVTETLIL